MSTPNGAEHFKFGPFELHIGTGELFKAGVAIKLQPQPFRLLLLLVSRPHELITREQIQAALWSDGTTVEFDQSLNYCIRQIRAVLGDDASDPTYIETLPKRGYRFIAPVAALRKTESPPPPTSKRSWIWLTALAAAATVFLLFLAARTTQPRDVPQAILVRPLVNLGLPEEDAWFGDALAQQLIGALADTKSVRVVPWSSSLALKGRTVSLRELGRQFHVDAILEGSIRRSGDRLLVNTQLVDVATERTLWSHQDERGARDLANMQGDVMNAIAETLKLRLTEAAIPEARRHPRDLDTYNLYLRAVLLGDQFSPNAAHESVKEFEEVIRREPGYAPALAGLANSLAILPFFQFAGAKQTLTRAKDAAERAIALDPSLPTAHAALAQALFNDWDWKASEREFQTALSLDPDSATTLHLYGLLLISQGRIDEAIRAARRATDLAPTSAPISHSLAIVLFQGGNLDEAIAQCRRTMELDRGFGSAYSVLARAYALKGMSPEALQSLAEWQQYEPEARPSQLLWKAYQLALFGHRQPALQAIDKWLDSNPRASSPPLALAAALLAAGEKDRALEAVCRSLDHHVPSMLWVKSAPELASLRSDPGFIAAVSRMNVN